MNLHKAVVLVIGILVIAAIIAFQFRTASRPVQGAQAAEGGVPQAGITAPAHDTTPRDPAQGLTIPVNSISIPVNGWGRNPFLTIEEIAAMNAPAEPQPVTVVPEPVVPVVLPEPALSGIIWNPNGPVAIINSQVVRVGDRVGSETVKEIKSESVVLESEGKTREIPLKPAGMNTRPAAARGELQ